MNERIGELRGSTADPAPGADEAFSFVSGNERLHSSLINELDREIDRNGYLLNDLTLIDQQKLTTLYRKLNATDGQPRTAREEIYGELLALLQKAIA